MNVIKVTEQRRGTSETAVCLVNPSHIVKACSYQGVTVITLSNSDYPVWCVETPSEIYDMIGELNDQ